MKLSVRRIGMLVILGASFFLAINAIHPKKSNDAIPPTFNSRAEQQDVRPVEEEFLINGAEVPFIKKTVTYSAEQARKLRTDQGLPYDSNVSGGVAVILEQVN